MKQILIKAQKLSKVYKFKKKFFKNVLSDVSFDILKGEIISLLGVNGAGKTTLSSIIASLLSPSSGDVLFEDKSIYKNLLNYRMIVGFCPQSQNIDTELSLKQNLLYQGRYYGLSKKELEDRVDCLMHQFELNEYAKSKVDILSGGYKQRFLLAKTLIHNPKLVILDEPTVGLDPQIRREIWLFIKKLKKENKSVLLTTHYLDEAEKLSDRVCVIDKGKIKIINSPENLKKDWEKKNLEEVFLHLLKEGEKSCLV